MVLAVIVVAWAANTENVDAVAKFGATFTAAEASEGAQADERRTVPRIAATIFVRPFPNKFF